MKKLEIIERYLKLKKTEKILIDEISEQKALFFAAMDNMECDQLEIAGALIYKSERRTFEYSKAIIDAENSILRLHKRRGQNETLFSRRAAKKLFFDFFTLRTQPDDRA